MSKKKRFQLGRAQIEEYLVEAQQVIRQMKPRIERQFPSLARDWYEDALSHVWMKLEKGAFDPSRRFAPWCQSVLRNFKFDAGRRRCRRDRVFATSREEHAAAEADHLPDDTNVVQQVQRREAAAIHAARFSSHDLVLIGELDLLARVAVLCKFDLWHKVPADLWRRWCRQLEEDHTLQQALPLKEVQQAEDSRRHRILAQALNMRSNTLLQKIIRAKRQLGQLVFLQQLEQAI